MSAARPEVGDVWRFTGGDPYPGFVAGEEVTITDEEPPCKCGTHVRLVRPDGKRNGWCRSQFMQRFAYLRGPEPAKVDWAKWLPKAPLPDTGPKEFKVGQVWGLCQAYDRSAVYRVESVGRDGEAECAPLAECGPSYGRQRIGPSLCAVHMRLIQDVGEPHPRPVEQVYGVAKAVEWKVGQRRRGEIRFLGCGELIAVETYTVEGRSAHGPGFWNTVSGCIVSEAWPSELLEDVTEGAAMGEPGGSAATESTASSGGQGKPDPRAAVPPPPPSSRPAPLGMSEADIRLLVEAAPHLRHLEGVARLPPKGTSEAELEALANPWKRRRP